MSEASSTASLDELIAINIAGDIEAVADFLDGPAPNYPDHLEYHEDLWQQQSDASARLRRIAAGIRGLV